MPISPPSERAARAASWLYLLNATLLITHEIDSAYWNEWTLFQLPGGIQLFLLFHVFVIPLVLYGFWCVVLWKRGAELASFLLAGSGLAAFLIHAYFLGIGREEFRLPVSLALLVGIAAVSLSQGFVVARICGRERAPGRTAVASAP